MANLKDFVWEKTKAGMDFDVYVSRVIRVGNYKVQEISETQLNVEGKANLPLIGNVAGSVNILIQDPEKCTVKLSGGGKQETLTDCPYHVSGNQLLIDIKKKLFEILYIDQVVLSGRDRLWTWIGFSVVPNVFSWVGGWPKGLDIADEDFVRDKFTVQTANLNK